MRNYNCRHFPYDDRICWEVYTYYSREPEHSCMGTGFVGII